MKILHSVVRSMNKEEIRHLKIFLGRNGELSSRKDVELFDIIKKESPQKAEEQAFQKLYSGKDKNSYYRLKNRLLNDIGKSLNLLHFDKQVDNTAFNLIQLANHQMTRQNFQSSLYYLKKAEKKCLETRNLALLKMIYNEFIKLARTNVGTDPQVYIDKRNELQEEIEQLQKLDDLIATLHYQMRTTQGLSSEKERKALLKETLNEHIQIKTGHQSVQFRTKLFEAISRLLLEQQDFSVLLEYLTRSILEFEENGWFTKQNIGIKLQMLIYKSNSHFKLGDHKASLETAKELDETLQKVDKSLQSQYEIFYYNILVNNYSQLNKTRAIEIIEEALTVTSIKALPDTILFLKVNMSLLHFDLKKFKAGARILSRLKLTSAFENISQEVQLKIQVVELVMRYEAGKHLNAIDDCKKLLSEQNFKNQLHRQKLILELLAIMMETSNIHTSKEVKSQLQKIKMSYHMRQEEDILNFHDWLSEKFANF